MPKESPVERYLKRKQKIVITIMLHYFVADECQKKWKNLRDAYVSWRRRVQQNKKSGQEVKAIKEYRFAKEMEFLIPYTANRKYAFVT